MALEDIIRDRQNLGFVAGMQKGEREGADLRSVLASTNHTNAQTDRYTQETPSYLRKSEAAARAGELGNVQGEADLAAGVPTATAQKSYAQAQLDAKKAESALDQLPAETRIKLYTQVNQESTGMLQAMAGVLKNTGSTEATLGELLRIRPELEKDPEWSKALQRYKTLSPQALQMEINKKLQELASSADLSNPETQKALRLNDQKHMQDMELQGLRGQQGIAEAGIRAASSGSSTGPVKQNAAEILRDLGKQYVAALDAHDQASADKLLWQINVIKNTKPDEASFAGIPGKPGTQVKPFGAANTSDPNLAKLPKGSTALGNGVYQLPNGTKVKAN